MYGICNIAFCLKIILEDSKFIPSCVRIMLTMSEHLHMLYKDAGQGLFDCIELPVHVVVLYIYCIYLFSICHFFFCTF